MNNCTIFVNNRHTHTEHTRRRRRRRQTSQSRSKQEEVNPLLLVERQNLRQNAERWIIHHHTSCRIIKVLIVSTRHKWSNKMLFLYAVCPLHIISHRLIHNRRRVTIVCGFLRFKLSEELLILFGVIRQLTGGHAVFKVFLLSLQLLFFRLIETKLSHIYFSYSSKLRIQHSKIPLAQLCNLVMCYRISPPLFICHVVKSDARNLNQTEFLCRLKPSVSFNNHIMVRPDPDWIRETKFCDTCFNTFNVSSVMFPTVSLIRLQPVDIYILNL